MYRVGLTGGIASGKTTVGNLFAAHGVPVIDTDEIARDVVAVGTPLLARLVDEFGSKILQPDGSLDRRVLRARVFDDADARARLESLTHPAIRAEMEARSARAGGPYQMLAIPLLVESGMLSRVDRVLVVDASDATRVRRVQARDASTESQAQAILRAQIDRETRLAAADDVIHNDGAMSELQDQVKRLHSQYLAAAAE